MKDRKNILEISKNKWEITDRLANLQAVFYSSVLAIWYMNERPTYTYVCERFDDGSYNLWRIPDNETGALGYLQLHQSAHKLTAPKPAPEKPSSNDVMAKTNMLIAATKYIGSEIDIITNHGHKVIKIEYVQPYVTDDDDWSPDFVQITGLIVEGYEKNTLWTATEITDLAGRKTTTHVRLRELKIGRADHSFAG